MSLIRLSDRLDLVPTSDFPHGKYPFESFNQVQSRVFEIHDRNCNCVIAAPTSVGKTVCAEMFMADEVRVRGGKAIYLAPLRALAKEKIDDWTASGSIFSDLKIAICTGDYRLTDSKLGELERADIIVMTSEMLSSRCRNMESEKSEFLRSCGTIVVDESHLLTVPGRGDHLEVGLMKFSAIARDPRIVFLSATMPNVDEIANWVGCSLSVKDTYLVTSEYRPCPLDIHYEEYETGESYELSEEYKVSRAVDLVREHKDDKFLVFVHSKATGERVRHALEERGVKCELHNADLEKEKRHDVEKRFKYGDLRVIVATSTLAWGCYKHGSMVRMADGSDKDIADVSLGDELFCPFGGGSAKVLSQHSFGADFGYRVRLAGGLEMAVSEDHVFLSCLRGGNPDWNGVNGMAAGDLIAVFEDPPKNPLPEGLHPVLKSESRDLSELPISWLKIENIEAFEGGMFKEIEVESPHAYVGAGAISHNCNFPSRRVVITGVHRGMSEVETYDIFQMAGRAGRPGFDPRGDVYILLPDKDYDHHVDRLSSPKKIESQLLASVGKEDPHYKTLAFHIVSEIHHGNISTKDDMHEWYSKSLAYFQYEDLDESIADKTLDLLLRVGAIREESGRYEVTSVGKVSSMLYYSPFDVADLRRNFRYLFTNGKEHDDVFLSVALGNVDSIRMGFVTRAEKDEMSGFYDHVVRRYGGEQLTESSVKGAYAYYCLMNGLPLGPFSAMARGLQMDFDRLVSVLNMLDSFAAKWNKKGFFSSLSLRVSYGVKMELVDLCRIPGIGKVRAERLYAAGFRKPSDLSRDRRLLAKVLNMKDEKVSEILEASKSIST